MSYVYPAVLQPSDGMYSVYFPDVDGAFTSGKTLAEALEMAKDALCVTLVSMEDNGEALKAPTPMNEVAREEGDVVTLIVADTVAYRKTINTRAVKKTLSIPQWMNEAAEKRGINFSQVLQEALAERLS